jgi:hypothetical protein
MKGARARLGATAVTVAALAGWAPDAAAADAQEPVEAAPADAVAAAAQIVGSAQIAGPAQIGAILPELPIEVPLVTPAEPVPVEAPPPPDPPVAAETPVPPPAPDAPLPRESLANVNVSVRVDSPGTDGDVAQANTVEAPAGRGTDERSGDTNVDISEYQRTEARYRIVNLNIAIRINSPGDNGPVIQGNVALGARPVARAAEAPFRAAVAALPPPLSPALHATSPSPLPPMLPLRLLASIALPAGPPEPSAPHVGDETATGPPPAEPQPQPGVAAAPERPASVFAGGAAAAPRAGPVPAAPVAVVARLERRARGAAHAAGAAPRPQARPAARPPRRAAGEEGGPAAAPLDRLGTASAEAPERRLPVAALALLAFVFAFLHSTLVSARVRPTPEAEADAPPDRPG